MLSNRESKLLEDQIQPLQRYARKLAKDPDEADELVQDSFERAIRRFDQFKTGTNLRSWLFTIMHNIFCDRFRHRRRRGVVHSLDETAYDIPRPASQMASIELREVSNGFEKLSRPQRELIVTVGLEGKTYEQAARHYGVAVGTIKSRLSRARGSLRERSSLRRGRGTPVLRSQ